VGDNPAERGKGAGAQCDTQDQEPQATIMAALLRSLRWASLLGVVLTGAVPLIGYSTNSISSELLLALVFVVGLLGVYIAIRIEFDARLLDHYAHANFAQWRAFDAAMMQLGLLASDKAGRGLAERLRGMRRLALLQIALLALQAALLLVAVI
jgi:hypothetical protein